MFFGRQDTLLSGRQRYYLDFRSGRTFRNGTHVNLNSKPLARAYEKGRGVVVVFRADGASIAQKCGAPEVGVFFRIPEYLEEERPPSLCPRGYRNSYQVY